MTTSRVVDDHPQVVEPVVALPAPAFVPAPALVPIALSTVPALGEE